MTVKESIQCRDGGEKGKCYSLQDHREKEGCRDGEKRKGAKKGKICIDYKTVCRIDVK